MKSLDGLVTVITGAGSGMGRASAQVFHREGAKVVASDITGQEQDTVAALGGEAFARHCDVSREEDVAALMDSAVERFGRIDVVLNVAGLGVGGALHDTTIKEFEHAMGINLRGVFLGMKHAIRHMLQAGGGSVINWSSSAALLSPPGTSLYAATKHGVVGLTKVAAADYGKRGIRVNCICPGQVLSEGMGAAAVKAYPEFGQSSAMGRAGETIEVAEVAAFLASAKASYVTGAIIPVDGGLVVNRR